MIENQNHTMSKGVVYTDSSLTSPLPPAEGPNTEQLSSSVDYGGTTGRCRRKHSALA